MAQNSNGLNPWQPPWYCNCGKGNPQGIVTCSSCKKPKIVGEVRKDDATEVKSHGLDDLWRCESCNKENKRLWEHCTWCGLKKPENIAYFNHTGFVYYVNDPPTVPTQISQGDPLQAFACTHCSEHSTDHKCRCDRSYGIRRSPNTFAMDMLEIDWLQQGFSFDSEFRRFRDEQKGS